MSSVFAFAVTDGEFIRFHGDMPAWMSFAMFAYVTVGALISIRYIVGALDWGRVRNSAVLGAEAGRVVPRRGKKIGPTRRSARCLWLSIARVKLPWVSKRSSEATTRCQY